LSIFRKVLTLFALLILHINIEGQIAIIPEKLTIEDGLSQGYVNAILQDREGFLWIGTKDGLNRYDGEKFRVFTSDPFDSLSLSNNYVTSLVEVGDYILVGTQGGLNFYYKPHQKFYKISAAKSIKEEWDNLHVGFSHQDAIGNLWVSEFSGNKAYKIDLPSKLTISKKGVLDSIRISKIPNSNYKLVLKSDENHITFQTTDSLCTKIDIRTNESKQQSVNCIILESHSDLYRTDFSFEKQTIHSNNTLYIEENGQILELDLIGNFNYIYYHKEEKNLWFTDSNNKLFLLQNWTPDQGKPIKKKAVKIAEHVKQLYWDKSGIIWGGTYGLGLIKLSPRQLKTKTYFQGTSIMGMPFLNSKGEVFYLKGFKEDEYPMGFPPFFRKLNRPEIFEYEKDHYYIVARKGNKQELVIFKHNLDEGTEEIKHIKNIFPTGDYGYATFTSHYEKETQTIWIVYRGKLIEIDLQTQEEKIFSFESLHEYSYSCNNFCKTANQHYWIATDKGLIQGIPETSNGKTNYEFVLHQLKKGKDVTLRHNIVSSLLPDPEDDTILWIGTKGGGLHRLDLTNMSFEYLNTKNGLPNDVIYGILHDDKSNLWMSSNKGIIKYNKENKLISNFTSADGLQSDEFNTRAINKTHDGSFLFGGINGLNVFHPDDFKENPFVPSVQITNLEINNHQINNLDSSGILNKSIEYTTDISLPYSKNNVVLEFAALEFSAPQKNKFAYYLDGMEEPWIHQSTENRAQYLGLSPGQYTFKIKAANGDEVWNENHRELHITIVPPWYASMWAYILYALIFGLGIWLILRIRDSRYHLKLQMEHQKNEADRLIELDETKSKLYTNITHEFRTPLSVISGLTSKLKGNQESKEIIKRNSDQLLNLVNQMLDLRKLKSGEIEIKKKQADFIKYFRFLTDSLKGYSKQQDVEIHFLSNDESIIMDFDPEKMARIHSNLLSNAIKFTPAGGHIYIHVSRIQETKGSAEIIQVEVRDTGIGIAEDKLSHIFERFYQVDNSSTRQGEGTGIGLTLVDELIRLMGGSLEVQSKLGAGSTFRFNLDITNEAPFEEIYEKEYFIEPEIPPTPDVNNKKTGSTHINSSENSTLANLLIVEDNKDVVHYLVSCLASSYNLTIASNGEEGIATALELVPDLIISDVMMPIKDGFELCQTLKKDTRTSHIPIVLLTAKASFESKLTGLERGANAYLSKPFNGDELILTLKNQMILQENLHKRFLQNAKKINQDVPKDLAENAALLQHLKIEDSFLLKIRSIIEENLSNSEIGMPQLMRSLSMSRSQIYKKVKALTGVSPSHYIRSIRLHHASVLLKETKLNVSEVAYKVGFSNPSYFSTIFLEEYGHSPSETIK